MGRLTRFQIQGYWVEFFLEHDARGVLGWVACLELPNERGVITGGNYSSFEEAEFATNELILSWN